MLTKQWWVARSARGFVVGAGDVELTHEISRADAHLIAAAPSLADAALRALIHLSDPEPDENEGDAIVLLLCDALRMAGRLNKNLEE